MDKTFYHSSSKFWNTSTYDYGWNLEPLMLSKKEILAINRAFDRSVEAFEAEAETEAKVERAREEQDQAELQQLPTFGMF